MTGRREDAPRPATAAPAREPHLPADPSSAGPLPAGRGAPAAKVSGALIGGFLVLVAAVAAFGAIAEGLREHDVFNLDAIATDSLHRLSSPALDSLMQAFTTMGSSLVLVPLVVITALILISRGRPGGALFLVVASLGSLLLNFVLKLFFQRPRPIVPWAVAPTDFSFPSGHTMNSAVVYGAIAIIVWSIAGRRAGPMALAVATFLATAIGISRIYLGFHYLSDVVGGALAAIAWLLLVVAAFRIPPLRRYWIVPPAAGPPPVAAPPSTAAPPDAQPQARSGGRP